MNNVAYSTFILKNKKDYLVYVPDLDVNTEGKSLEDAIEMAKDIIGITIVDMEDNNKKVPKSTSYEDALKKLDAIKNVVDFSKGIHTIVQVDIKAYRTKLSQKTVRRNVTIPEYLNDFANEINLNVSNFLTMALQKELNCSVKIPMPKNKINFQAKKLLMNSLDMFTDDFMDKRDQGTFNK